MALQPKSRERGKSRRRTNPGRRVPRRAARSENIPLMFGVQLTTTFHVPLNLGESRQKGGLGSFPAGLRRLVEGQRSKRRGGAFALRHCYYRLGLSFTPQAARRRQRAHVSPYVRELKLSRGGALYGRVAHEPAASAATHCNVG
ncbi:unnamed protein product, partial [Iphiclides podalirius]